MIEFTYQQAQKAMINIFHIRLKMVSDVEAFHKLIQDELYDVESYENKKDFLIRAFIYILYFNYIRKFRYKGGKSPWQILKENSKITAKNKNAGLLMPIILDNKITSFYFKGDDY